MEYRIVTTLLTATLCCSTVFAEKIEHNGIYYNLNGNTAEVTYRGDEEDGWMYFSADELYSGTLSIPDTIVYAGSVYQVTSIGNDAFAGSKLLENLQISSAITTIGNGAFTLCNSLESITVANNNTYFFSYNGILYKKTPVELYFVPRNIQGDIELSEDITSIPSSAFQNCSNLTSITLPDKVTTIADGAFNNCTNLQDVFLNEGLTSIGEYAFSKCTSLTIISFPNSLKSIKACAFSDCTYLNYALIHEGLETIGKMAFYNCQNLTGIQLPSTLTAIADQAFLDCFSLDAVENNSALDVKIGETGNGYVAYYASEVTKGQSDTPIYVNNTQPTVYCNNGQLQIRNSVGKRLEIYDYDGRLETVKQITEKDYSLNVGKQRVIVILK